MVKIKKYETLIVREKRNKRIPISENLSTIITNQEYKKYLIITKLIKN